MASVDTAPAAETGFKVFAGNLPFTTTEAELVAAFQTSGAKVTSANIIRRGTRSLGYGFVECPTEADAQKAVDGMRGKPMGDREINVQLARAREEKAAGSSAAPRAPRASPAPAAPGSGSAPGTGRPRSNRGRGPRQGGRSAGDSSSAPAPAAAAGAQGTAAPRRAPRPVRNNEDRPLSKTSVFVANLPFNVDDAQLSALFAGLSVKSAHVVRTPSGRSKGFGFVELSSEDEQKKAVDQVDQKSVGERQVSVKVAREAPPEVTNAGAGPAEVKA